MCNHCASVPQPARYAAHKLIIGQKRTGDPAKRRKDLVQAATLVEALSKADPFALTDAVADATSKGREGWARPLERSLAELQLKVEVA
ncbi:MAG: GSU2403 family nucleotidyltransferase fold protein [Microvirga sp.]